MSEQVKHFVVIGVGRTSDDPSGLVRRRFTSQGRIDEALQRNLSWKQTSAITRWEYGDLPGELQPISREEAETLIEKFRERWGVQD